MKHRIGWRNQKKLKKNDEALKYADSELKYSRIDKDKRKKLHLIDKKFSEFRCLPGELYLHNKMMEIELLAIARE